MAERQPIDAQQSQHTDRPSRRWGRRRHQSDRAAGSEDPYKLPKLGAKAVAGAAFGIPVLLGSLAYIVDPSGVEQLIHPQPASSSPDTTPSAQAPAQADQASISSIITPAMEEYAEGAVDIHNAKKAALSRHRTGQTVEYTGKNDLVYGHEPRAPREQMNVTLKENPDGSYETVFVDITQTNPTDHSSLEVMIATQQGREDAVKVLDKYHMKAPTTGESAVLERYVPPGGGKPEYYDTADRNLLASDQDKRPSEVATAQAVVASVGSKFKKFFLQEFVPPQERRALIARLAKPVHLSDTRNGNEGTGNALATSATVWSRNPRLTPARI